MDISYDLFYLFDFYYNILISLCCTEIKNFEICRDTKIFKLKNLLNVIRYTFVILYIQYRDPSILNPIFAKYFCDCASVILLN